MVASAAAFSYFSYNRRVPTRPTTLPPATASQPCLAGRNWMAHAQVFAARQHLPAAHP